MIETLFLYTLVYESAIFIPRNFLTLPVYPTFITYYLYKFINAETRYNIYNKELYAIIKALKH